MKSTPSPSGVGKSLAVPNPAPDRLLVDRDRLRAGRDVGAVRGLRLELDGDLADLVRRVRVEVDAPAVPAVVGRADGAARALGQVGAALGQIAEVDPGAQPGRVVD